MPNKGNGRTSPFLRADLRRLRGRRRARRRSPRRSASRAPGFRVVCVGAARAARPGPHGRAARAARSISCEDLGVWARSRRAAAPMRALRIVDDTGSLFAPRPVEFRASRDRPRRVRLEHRECARSPNPRRSARAASRLSSIAASGRTASISRATRRRHDSRRTAASLGARWSSAPTGAARRPARRPGSTRATRRYGQSALTSACATARPHDDVSTEFHTREGPFTLVPLPPTPEAPNRSSLVWLMSRGRGARRAALDDEALAARDRAPGARRCSARCGSRASAALFPMVRPKASRAWSRRAAGAGRRRRARLSADRRAGAQSRPARRRGADRPPRPRRGRRHRRRGGARRATPPRAADVAFRTAAVAGAQPLAARRLRAGRSRPRPRPRGARRDRAAPTTDDARRRRAAVRAVSALPPRGQGGRRSRSDGVWKATKRYCRLDFGGRAIPQSARHWPTPHPSRYALAPSPLREKGRHASRRNPPASISRAA